MPAPPLATSVAALLPTQIRIQHPRRTFRRRTRLAPLPGARRLHRVRHRLPAERVAGAPISSAATVQSRRRLWLAVSPTATSHSCCRFALKENTGSAGCAGSARTCATTTRRCWRADFRERVELDRFLAIWQILQAQMQSDPLLRHDWIDFAKMPKKVGDQINPFTYLEVTPNASGTHLAHLTENWEAFYVAKRSSSTRRRDRTKRAHLAKHGDIRFVTATDAGDAQRTVETLMEQKSRAFARKGIPDLFARPGHREFFLDLATNPATRQLAHISRTEVGATSAAANLGLMFGDCYYHVLASYTDSELSSFGPGNLHLREMMAYAIARGLKRFDFTIGDEPYKLEWSDTDTVVRLRHAGDLAGNRRRWRRTFTANQAAHQTNAVAVAAGGRCPLPDRSEIAAGSAARVALRQPSAADAGQKADSALRPSKIGPRTIGRSREACGPVRDLRQRRGAASHARRHCRAWRRSHRLPWRYRRP